MKERNFSIWSVLLHPLWRNKRWDGKQITRDKPGNIEQTQWNDSNTKFNSISILFSLSLIFVNFTLGLNNGAMSHDVFALHCIVLFSYSVSFILNVHNSHVSTSIWLQKEKLKKIAIKQGKRLASHLNAGTGIVCNRDWIACET